jgi:hypothetical protein
VVVHKPSLLPHFSRTGWNLPTAAHEMSYKTRPMNARRGRRRANTRRCLRSDASASAVKSGAPALDEEQAYRAMPSSLPLLAQRWHVPGVVLSGVLATCSGADPRRRGFEEAAVSIVMGLDQYRA